MVFDHDQNVECGGERFAFRTQSAFRLFYSYRYTPELLTWLLGQEGISIETQILASSGEEGAWLAEGSTVNLDPLHTVSLEDVPRRSNGQSKRRQKR